MDTFAHHPRLGTHEGVNRCYISGFFDGEGGVSVLGRAGANALALKATVSQKSTEVLRRIKSFLSLAGIFAVIYTYKNGLSSLEVRRVDDLARFLRSLKLVVKHLQLWITSMAISLAMAS
jgi:intein/homing endonuclease